jgi:DNA-binding MarR family transcriptional regulator
MGEPNHFEIEFIFEFMHLYNNTLFRGASFSDYYNEGLNRAHVRTMIFLHIHHGGTMTDVSRCVALEKGSFTPVANKLLELGYIEKIGLDEDKRKVFLALTPKGVAYAERVMQEHIAHFETQLAKLSNKERNDFIKSLNTLYRLLEKMKHQK